MGHQTLMALKMQSGDAISLMHILKNVAELCLTFGATTVACIINDVTIADYDASVIIFMPLFVS